MNETVEAVIISGPRKGEIVRFDGNGNSEPQLSPEEEAMLDFAVEKMRSAAATATQIAQELRAFNQQAKAQREAA